MQRHIRKNFGPETQGGILGTAAIEVLLGLPLLHLQVEAEAKAGLRFNDQWKPKSESFERAYITQDMKKEPILQMGSDKMNSRHVYEKPFTTRFPDRSEWKKGFQRDRRGDKYGTQMA
jgi:hypothetical protein